MLTSLFSLLSKKIMSIRNLAIIAHVDHGKTTLIDGLFKQAGVFDEHKAQEERVMDSGDQEKERGITIRAKNASLGWKDTRINIVDTPGHADFGGEVERALFMVDGALLLVDAAEGPLPQTRFVLKKALEQNIKIIVVINKVDRHDARIDEIEEKVLELFYEVASSDDQVNFTTFYASAKNGWASATKNEETSDFSQLLDAIVKNIPSPKIEENAPFKMLVTNLSYSNFVGQVAIGRVVSGSVKLNERIKIIDCNNAEKAFNVTSLETFSGLGTEAIPELGAGNIALLSGMKEPKIGDTICAEEVTTALPRISVDPPTVSMRMSVNTSPFAGKDGKYATSRKLEELLSKACLNNVALSYEKTDTSELFMVKGRGELQLVVLLEELRREGYEMMVGRPEVLAIEQDGQMMESEENLVVDLPEDSVGAVTEMLSQNGGRMEFMEKSESSKRARLEFKIPTRGLIGIRSRMMTLSRGEAIYASSLNGYIPYQGKRFSRKNGAIVCDRPGTTSLYALDTLESRGKLFLREGIPCYEGMIFGENNRKEDLNANPTKEKKLTNMRASGKDEASKIAPIKDLTLDEALEWIDEDEWIEITPKTIRLRKQELRTNMRKIVRS